MIALHPNPVPCQKCGTILQATHALENDFACPTCHELACYTCGCTDSTPCEREISTPAGPEALVCFWISPVVSPHVWMEVPGMCSFCFTRAAYELFQEANGEPADDPQELAGGRTVRAYKSLSFGV